MVTQEVDDIISSPVVKETIINNSDCKILYFLFFYDPFLYISRLRTKIHSNFQEVLVVFFKDTLFN